MDLARELEIAMSAKDRQALRLFRISLVCGIGTCIGCQSVTQQKPAWSFAFQKESGQDSNFAINRMDIQPPGRELESFKGLASEPPVPKVFSLEAQPKKDAALVQTGAEFRGVEMPLPELPPKPGGQQATSVPGSKPVAIDPKTAEKIVQNLVAASTSIAKTGVDPVDTVDGSVSRVDPFVQRTSQPPMLLPPAGEPEKINQPGLSKPVPVASAVSGPTPKAQQGSVPGTEPTKTEYGKIMVVSIPKQDQLLPKDKPARSGHGSGKAMSESSLPPLESLPPAGPEPVALPKKPELMITKAAICREVKGRGQFEALPANHWAPGSTILVYWELDGLTRSRSDESASISATVELLQAERNLILASVREGVEGSRTTSKEGDYLALQWTIPTDIKPGEYRLRITTTDLNAKVTGQTEIDLPLVMSETVPVK